MKKSSLLLLLIFGTISISATTSIDMQAHIGTDEAKQAYTDYLSKQATYYQNTTLSGEGDTLFGELNRLMGSTCRIGNGSFTYNSLKNQYINVDKDLNNSSNIIGYYDGSSMKGAWGNHYNREHTWPQSKGADKGIPMGHDMHSVRPTNTNVNGDRGNTAYGESSKYYDPDDVDIDNTDYRKENMGSYRGDAARVILYDYLVYGQRGSHKNSLYNGNAQLLNKLGSGGVFESLYVMIKWHMQDPPSLTEMVRNDGAQVYQGNCNPFIDYPDMALRIMKSNITSQVYAVSTSADLKFVPSYTYTLADGFVCYLSDSTGFRPTTENLIITGAQYEYNADLGRLTIKHVTDNVTISMLSTNLIETQQHPTARKRFCNGQIIIKVNGVLYNSMGQQL